MDVKAQQSGNIAQHNVYLSVAITVHNHTKQTISLFGSCQQEAIVVSLTLETPAGSTIELTGSPNCILGTSYHLQPDISAYNAHIYVQKYNIFSFDSRWQAGTYVVAAEVSDWRTPTASGPHGSAVGHTSITLI